MMKVIPSLKFPPVRSRKRSPIQEVRYSCIPPGVTAVVTLKEPVPPMSFSPLHRLRYVLATLLVACCCALPLTAQTSATGNISGTVTDATGGVVPGATVVITNTDTGVSRTTETNSAGIYTATFLLPGHYEIDASGASFGKVERKNLTLTVGAELTINAVLPASSVTTDVEVNAGAVILDTDKTEVSQTLGENLIANLPVATRNWDAFVLLTPNVTQDGGSGLIAFHGISGLYNENYVDGANNNEILFSEARGRASGAPYVYSSDSIKEFQAETSNYSVEFGQAAGGQVNAITKNGTNSIHGDAFYYLRYPTLNALDPYSKFVGRGLSGAPNPFLLTQPIHQQNQFGGSVGGPILKDRLFYFFTYDGFRKVGRVLYSDTNTITATPTASNAGGTVISPTQCPATITATLCANGINFLLGVGNITGAPPGRFQKENLFFPRLDYHLNSRNDIFVDFNFSDFDSTYGYSPANTFSNSSPSTNGPTSYHERFLVGGLTTQIGKASVNQVHAQWGRDLETAGANASGPSVATGVLTFGMPNALPRIAEPDEHRIQFTDVFSTTKGHHTLKFGGDVNIVHEVMINLYQGGGLYAYADTNNAAAFADWIQDAFAGQPGDSDPYAGYRYNTFVQTIDVVNPISRAGADDFWMKMLDGFGEDSWKVTPKFTLTAGVRYDVQLTPAPGKINTNYAPLSTYYSQTIKNVLDRVQPRVGFAWNPMPGTVFRGGYGMFSALNQGSTYYAMRVENGVVQINYNYTGCESGSTQATRCPTVPTTTEEQYPNVPFPVTGPSLSNALYPTGGTAPAVKGPTALGAQSFHGLDPNFVPPLAHEADLSIEQSLPGKMSLSVGYVGTRALRLPVFVDSNLIGQTPHGIRTYDVLNSSNTVTSVLTVPVYLQSDRRNGALTQYNTGFSVANTWYNSLAVTVRRPFQNGLEVIGNYTWARATDTSQVGGANGTFYGGDVPLDPNNIRLENGPSDTDIRSRFTLSFVYQPKLFESSKIFKQVVDGFVFSGDEIASGGQPIYLGMGGSTIYSGSGTSYGADGGIYGGAMSSGSGAATQGRPPQIGRNSIYGPGFNDVDFRLSHNFPLWEKAYLQFSADAFNLLNHKIVTSVSSTYSQYAAASASAASACSTAVGTATASTVPVGSTLQGCISPYTGTGLSAFGAPSGTNNLLYSARQMQFAAKLFF